MERKCTISVEHFVSLLLKCRKQRDLARSMETHLQIALYGYEAQAVLGNSLVQAYAVSGCMHDAHSLFNTLVDVDEYSWTSLIQVHVDCREYKHALALFHIMEKTVVQPSTYTFVAVAKACGHLKALDPGFCVHMKIVKMGLDGDSYIGNALLSMYIVSGSLVEAQILFDLLRTQIVVSWNILITGYLEHGLVEKSLECIDHMQLRNVSPNEITLIAGLKACSSLRAVLKGRDLHSKVIILGFDMDLSVETTLVNLYSKCVLPTEAQAVVFKLQASSVVPWNALITGYVENNSGKEALGCIDKMQLHGIPPNVVTFVCGLKACVITQDLDRGQELHCEIVKAGFDNVPSAGNSLMALYAKSGAILETCEVFNKLPNKSIVSWTSLISGFVDYGANEKALDCFEKMCVEGLAPDAAAFVCGLKACGSLETASMGRELHAMILAMGHERNLYVGNVLLDTYLKTGFFADGQGVFNFMPFQNVVSWNTLIAGYTEYGFSSDSLLLYNQMQLEGMFPDVTTFICTLKACGSAKEVSMGRQVHASIVFTGLESDGIVGNSIVDMYTKCGQLKEAHYVFDLLPSKSIVSWNSIIAGFSELGLSEDVLRLVDEMRIEHFSLDTTTYVYSLKACCSLKFIAHCQEHHEEIILKGLEGHPFIVSAVVDMYANCGLLREAQDLLDGLPARNVIVWTALITGYAEHGLSFEALESFERMILDGILPNIITYACTLKVCGNLSALYKGEEVHSRVTKEGLIDFHAEVYGKSECRFPNPDGAVEFEGTESLIFNSLIEMYCKCGCMVDAHYLFNLIPVADILTWSALLTGYARQGDTEHVLHLFDKARKTGIKPNEVMFLAILSVCSHGGLVGVGQHCFEAMIGEYLVLPALEHYNCLMDLLSRAGKLEEAVAVLENLPFGPDLVTWSTLLGASRNWGDVDLGRQSFEWVARLDEGNAAAYIVMSNIYAEAGMPASYSSLIASY
ncbi:hypothetical protein GOP47_0007858 [Adiantum capillus-veneris]|uniref:Pentatricopeptide repeat-containing protein n=1 Tax=Adiantum capillus-veneris TaxID=13818 RepID=A0A9D4V1V3_ADICA|nr:hypothetical protein GOP47_0007858 [Adiantum capillus-veneris]